MDHKSEFPVLKNKQQVASIEIMKCHFKNRYTFLDYIHGGCDVSLFVVMDFTMSNLKFDDPLSTHYINPLLIEEF